MKRLEATHFFEVYKTRGRIYYDMPILTIDYLYSLANNEGLNCKTIAIFKIKLKNYVTNSK